MRAFELTIRVRNNLLKERRQKLGMNAREFAATVGIHYSLYVGFETLHESPIGVGGKWRSVAQKIAEFYGVACDELWPNEVLAVKQSEIVRKVEAEHLHALALYAASQSLVADSPELELERAETDKGVRRLVKCLTGRDRELVEMRFGLNGQEEHTLEEIGRKMKLSSQRVQQIESRVLKTLRQATRAVTSGSLVPS